MNVNYFPPNQETNHGRQLRRNRSNNATLFLPIDGLADVGEYTSRRILDIIHAVH
jgi:hypothetical protein